MFLVTKSKIIAFLNTKKNPNVIYKTIQWKIEQNVKYLEKFDKNIQSIYWENIHFTFYLKILKNI